MCGIAGIIGSAASENKLKPMLNIQQHRGPDHAGIYLKENQVALGHNRLSIIDLSEAAQEPFADNSKRYFLIFNGEIYNYLELKQELKPVYDFKTESDTEVLLAAYIHWGRKCLEKFNGMFSFAIWDSREKKLFAARDRFGVKPLYYSFDGNSFYFASEIKTLQAGLDRKKPNKKVWANYFSFGSYGMPEETFYEGIKQLSG